MAEVRDFIQSKINEARNGKVGGSLVGSMEVNGVKYTVTASIVRGGFLWLGRRIRVTGTAELLRTPQTLLANRSAAVTHSHPSGDTTDRRLVLEQTILIDPQSNAGEIESFVENIEVTSLSIDQIGNNVQDSQNYAAGAELLANKAEERSASYSFFSKERRFYKKLAVQLHKLSKEMESAIGEIVDRTPSDGVVSAIRMEKLRTRISKCYHAAARCLDRQDLHSLGEKEIILQNAKRALQGEPLLIE